MYVHSHSVRRFGLNYHQTSFDKYPFGYILSIMHVISICITFANVGVYICVINYMWVYIYAIKVYVYTQDSISVRYRNTAGFRNR